MFSKQFVLSTLIFLLLSFQTSYAQIEIDINEEASPANAKINRDRGLSMLKDIKEEIKQRYYDKNYRGINLDERFKAAEEAIKKLDNNSQIFRTIAQVLLEFKDSHTRFYPPSRAFQAEYGFTMQMIGNNCIIVAVKKGSDAETKGLKIGDHITTVSNFKITRGNLWVIKYLIYALDPQENLKLNIRNTDRTEREIQVKAAFKSIKDRHLEAEKRRKEKRENPYKCQEINTEIIACQLKTFSVGTKYIDKMMKEVGAHKKLILDLRGNGGGYVKTEEHLTGYFFDRDMKVATFLMRDGIKVSVAKSQKEKVFKGELAVLIDSNSASASEVFSRFIQLEKRGKVVGDVSAGAVMTSNFFSIANARPSLGSAVISFFGLNLTVADLIMSDGKRLENVGVIPDYPVGPTGKALFDKTDPILAYAAELFGAKMTAEEAGKFYFLIKKEENEDAEENSGDGEN